MAVWAINPWVPGPAHGQSLADALDTTNEVWTTGGWTNQTVATHDGQDAAACPDVPGGEPQTLEATVTGPALVSFWWRVADPMVLPPWPRDLIGQEPLRNLLFYVDGTQTAAYQPNSDLLLFIWKQVEVFIPSNTHTLRWVYQNRTQAPPADFVWFPAAAVDQLVCTPAFAPVFGVSGQPRSIELATLGMSEGFAAVAVGVEPIFYQWYFNHTNALTDATNSQLWLTNLQPAQAGYYHVVASNAFGCATSAVAGLDFWEPALLPEALDATNLVWTRPLGSWWGWHKLVSHDGDDAAACRPLYGNTEHALATTVPGPGTVTFWWKVSSQPGNEFFKFELGTNEQARISGEIDWVRQTVAVPAGEQTLRWTYYKVSGATPVHEEAWLDEVIWIPDDSRPRFLAPQLTTGAFVVAVSNVPGPTLFIESSTDLTNWTAFATNTATGGAALFSAPVLTNEPARFFRATPGRQ